jgi:hypothetical protein
MSSIDQLLHTTPADLVANIKALRGERADIETKERLLEQLLEVLTKQGGAIADEIAALGASAAIGPLRSQITQVLAEKRPDGLYFMVPQAIHDELVNRGNTRVKLDNVRQTMVRMADAKDLERSKPDALLFGLPQAMEDMPDALRSQLFGALQ